ncbi:transcriptional regulator, GntR family [Rubrobacter xylanophilus DSM 9941]|uniref:Transcriptional regulator, GntR family n=2 Tax=Rubrobacter xylanophilus TaxID=49319 RepID=Q1AZJ2_RUBXD|nr:transcriptional regulator, GntR family [Rubrobacter xylanophilus DSM 9941]
MRPGKMRRMGRDEKRAGSLSDVAYEKLYGDITGGRLQPNERLIELDIARELGVSRAAVRNALIRLEQEGLVKREPNRGARVRLVSEEEAVEILEARMALECVAVRHAALNRTQEDIAGLREILSQMESRLEAGDLLGASDLNGQFHRRLVEISNHATISKLLKMLNSQLIRFQYRTILTPGRPASSLAEHRAIFEAVEAGDPERAEQAMRRHLSGVTEALRRAAAQEAR